MAFLLDSDIVVPFLAGDAATKQVVDLLRSAGVSISIITYMEVLEGIVSSADPKGAQAGFDDFLTGIPVIPLSPEVARRCAELRRDLKRQGKRVRPRALDLITAATALHYGLTLFTRNTNDFADIPGLILY